MTGKSCYGCAHLLREDAGRGYEFCICELGKSETASRPVIERVKRGWDARPPIPAWCKLGLGEIVRG